MLSTKQAEAILIGRYAISKAEAKEIVAMELESCRLLAHLSPPGIPKWRARLDAVAHLKNEEVFASYLDELEELGSN